MEDGGIDDVEEEHCLEEGVCELWFLLEQGAGLSWVGRDEGLGSVWPIPAGSP